MRAETFSTSNLPAPQQFDAWTGWIDGAYDVVSSDSSSNSFNAACQIWQIGGGLLTCVRAPASRLERSVRHIRRNPLHHWIITLGRYATTVVSSRDTTFAVPPGTPFVLSLADEWTSEWSEDERLQLCLSRDQFGHLAPELDRARGVALNTTIGCIFADYLVLLRRLLPDIAADDVSRLRDAIGAMVAACFAPEKNPSGAAEPQIDLIRIERVHHVVRKYLRSPALGPHLLCRNLQMSRSKLYRLMEAEGGVARYIQRQRLLEAYASLCDPLVNRSVTVIAESLCFADMSGFNRAFRREFGATPSDVRASSHTTPKQGASATHANNAAVTTMRALLNAV